jgi:predicted lipoprotein with Yx(FWY)xxD motif
MTIIARPGEAKRPPSEGSAAIWFSTYKAGEGKLMRMRTTFALGAVLGAAALLAAGCGGAKVQGFKAKAGGVAGAQHVLKGTTVKTAKVKGLGTVLVNAKGFVLYVFAPDKHKKVTCKGSCAVVWPPLKASGKPTAGGSAKSSLLGLDGKVVTYAHWPLYTYVADTKPGEASGQDTNLNGGYWYVISPAGKVIKKP